MDSSSGPTQGSSSNKGQTTSLARGMKSSLSRCFAALGQWYSKAIKKRKKPIEPLVRRHALPVNKKKRPEKLRERQLSKKIKRMVKKDTEMNMLKK